MLNFIFARDLLQAFNQGQRKINKLLEKEGGCTLEELLLEDEVVQETKTSNNDLLKFLCQEENLSKLVDYALQSPQDSNNKDATFRFPFLAADILSNSTRLAEALMRGGEAPIEEEIKETEAE